MMNGQISGISYTGQAMANALKLLPHIEANFDGKHFMQAVMNELQGLGVMRESSITAVEHKGEIGSAIAHLVQNFGPTHSGRS